MRKNEKSEWEKLLDSEPYRSDDAKLVSLRRKSRELLQIYNNLDENLVNYRSILSKLLGTEVGENVFIQPPFYCDYGVNIHIGENFMANFNCVILDCAPVTFGDHVLLGPNVQIYAVGHPTDPVTRALPIDVPKAINIGNHVWIGGGSIILPGVTIGDNVIIGSGSVVTKDIESDVIAAGNPCRVIRRLNPEDYGTKMMI